MPLLKDAAEHMMAGRKKFMEVEAVLRPQVKGSNKVEAGDEDKAKMLEAQKLVAAASGPKQPHAAGVDLEYRLATLKIGVAATDHDSERAVLRTCLATGYRRIEKIYTALRTDL